MTPVSENPSEARGERFGRAKKLSAPEILELQHRRLHPTPLDLASYRCQALIHRAHVIMLTERGILTKDQGARILRGLREVEEVARGTRGS